MRGKFGDRLFHWCAIGAALCVSGSAFGAEVPPTTTEIFQGVTDLWYPAMSTVFTAVAALLVVFWAWRTVKSYIGRKTKSA